MICEKCGKIVDFPYGGLEKLEEEAAKTTGFVINSHRLEIYGVCPECHSSVIYKRKRLTAIRQPLSLIYRISVRLIGIYSAKLVRRVR